MKKIFKNVIQFQNLDQNIQKNQDKTPCRKEQIFSILDCPVHWTSILMYRIVFFKINLFKKCVKLQETKFRQFPAIVTHVSELFCVAPQINHACIHSTFCSLHVFDQQNFSYIQSSLSISKFTNKKFCPQAVMYQSSFVCSCKQSIFPIFIKSFKQRLYMIQLQNMKFDVSAVICF